MKPWPKLFLALDLPRSDLPGLLEEIGDKVPCFKVGLNTITSPHLMEVVAAVKDKGGRIFFDGKLHDIPNTVANAARSLTELGVGYFTVHASGGRAMMQAAREGAEERAEALGLAEAPAPIAVTVLTSMDQETWNGLYGTERSVADQVLTFVEQALEAGVRAVVASPLEVEAIRARFGTELAIVTPGVRPAWAAAGDQKRVASPSDAMAKGSSAMVIGRPILFPPKEVGSRTKAVELIAEEVGNLWG